MTSTLRIYPGDLDSPLLKQAAQWLRATLPLLHSARRRLIRKINLWTPTLSRGLNSALVEKLVPRVPASQDGFLLYFNQVGRSLTIASRSERGLLYGVSALHRLALNKEDLPKGLICEEPAVAVRAWEVQHTDLSRLDTLLEQAPYYRINRLIIPPVKAGRELSHLCKEALRHGVEIFSRPGATDKAAPGELILQGGWTLALSPEQCTPGARVLSGARVEFRDYVGDPLGVELASLRPGQLYRKAAEALSEGISEFIFFPEARHSASLETEAFCRVHQEVWSAMAWAGECDLPQAIFYCCSRRFGGKVAERLARSLLDLEEAREKVFRVGSFGVPPWIGFPTFKTWKTERGKLFLQDIFAEPGTMVDAGHGLGRVAVPTMQTLRQEKAEALEILTEALKNLDPIRARLKKKTFIEIQDQFEAFRDVALASQSLQELLYYRYQALVSRYDKTLADPMGALKGAMRELKRQADDLTRRRGVRFYGGPETLSLPEAIESLLDGMAAEVDGRKAERLVTAPE